MRFCRIGLGLLGLLALLVGCTGDSAVPSAEAALPLDADRPTLLLFFTDP
jgi:hypothetical protein